MIQYYPQFVSIIGWILLAGSVVISLVPLQFLTKGQSALGDDGVLHYFLAFCASLNVAWGLILIVAATDPILVELIALPSAVGFALLSAWRIPLSRHPDVLEKLGKAPMAEVVIFALIAATFFIAGLQSE